MEPGLLSPRGIALCPQPRYRRRRWQLRLPDIALGQLIFDTHCALRFDFDFVAHGLGHFFQASSGHIGVSDARRARRHRDNLHTAGSSLFGFFPFARVRSSKIESAVITLPVRIAEAYAKP